MSLPTLSQRPLALRVVIIQLVNEDLPETLPQYLPDNTAKFLPFYTRMYE